MVSTSLLLVWIAISLLFGFIEYGIYKAGSGYFKESKYVIVNKLACYGMRFVFSAIFAMCFVNYEFSNELITYSFGFYFLSSLPSKGVYFQLKNTLAGEPKIWFLSHSINHLLILRGKWLPETLRGKEYILLDTQAFGRILLCVFGYIILSVGCQG